MNGITLIVSLDNRETWAEIKNPLWASPTTEYYAACTLSSNDLLQYAEYSNGHSIYRVIRRRSLSSYKMKE